MLNTLDKKMEIPLGVLEYARLFLFSQGTLEFLSAFEIYRVTQYKILKIRELSIEFLAIIATLLAKISHKI